MNRRQTKNKTFKWYIDTFRLQGRIIILTLSLILCSHLQGRSQTYNNQIWIDYNLSVPVSNRFHYGGDAGFRAQTESPQLNTLYLRPTVSYFFSSVTAASAGMAHFLSWSPHIETQHEFRLQQQFSIRWPDIYFMSFLHRFRVDEQWFFNIENATRFNARVRYLLGAETDDIYLGDSQRPIYFKSQWEGFHRIASESQSDGRFLNDVRIHGAFGHRISRSFRYELHYIWQRQFIQSMDEVSLLYHIIRLRVYHFLNRSESKG